MSDLFSKFNEKAFDNVSWQFLVSQLLYRYFGETKYKPLMQSTKCRQQKKIINEELSQTINVHKGTREGCPLSPLLFILTLLKKIVFIHVLV